MYLGWSRALSEKYRTIEKGFILTMDSLQIRALLHSVLSDPEIHMQEPMKNHTCFAIGGPADFLVEPTCPEALSQLLPLLKQAGIPVTVIGNGSNLLVKDGGIRGVVIKIAEKWSSFSIDKTTVKAHSGALLSRLSSAIAKQSLTGFEFASGIPGTLGGALFMNAGAYGGEMKDIVSSVEVVNYLGERYTLQKEEMAFAYRNSRLGTTDEIAVSAILSLEFGDPLEIENRIKNLTLQRTTKQPVAAKCAGSTFKRPPGFFAGKLIEDCGLRGFRHGGAMVSSLHTGFIVNENNATAKDVLELIQIVQEKVQKGFGVFLEPEIKILGEA